MPKILIADDHAVTREPLARLLQYEGFDTATAANGLEALAALDSGSVDLLLMDMMMPKMDGLKLLEAVRADGRLRDTPVLVLTAQVEGSCLARARELNVCGIMTKAGFNLADLFDRVRQCLSGGDTPPPPRPAHHCHAGEPVAA